MINLLRQTGVGLYVWATPTQETVLALQALASILPPDFDATHPTDYHSTVLYCPEWEDTGQDQEVEALVQTDVASTAGSAVPTIWVDHKDRHIVVLLVQQPMLESINRGLQDYGLRHSFSDYNCHITLGKFVRPLPAPSVRKVEQLLREYWQKISSPVTYESELRWSLLLKE